MKAEFDVNFTREDLYSIPNADLVWIESKPVKQTALNLGNGQVRTRSALKKFAVETFSLISHPYLAQNEVCNPPTKVINVHTCIRPENYGRAALVELGDRLVEVKGCGVPSDQVPQNEPYRNGLYHIHNAVYELFCQRLAKRILKPITSFRTQECLALLKLPLQFRLGKQHDLTVSAAILVREPAFSFSLQDLKSHANIIQSDLNPFRIEMILRRHGFTTCNPFERMNVFEEDGQVHVRKGQFSGQVEEFGELQALIDESSLTLPVALDLLNIQYALSADSGALLIKDFEHYNSQELFSCPIATSLRSGESALLDKSKGLYVSVPEKFKIYNKLTQYSMIKHFNEKLGKFAETITTTPIHYYALMYYEHPSFSSRVSELIDVASGKAPSQRLNRFLERFYSNICSSFPGASPNVKSGAHAVV